MEQTIGQRIKLQMDIKDLTYYDMERLTGLSRMTIHRYANEKVTKIPLPNITAIANALGVSQEYLLGWEDIYDIKSIYDKLSSDNQRLLYEYAEFLLS